MTRSILVSFMTVMFFTLACETMFAQRPQRPRTIPQRTRKFYLDAPATKLEEIQDRLEQVIYKGFLSVGIVSGRNGSAEVNALELHINSEPARATGIAIQLADSTQGGIEIQSFIDYEEIDPLIRGLDLVARVDDTISRAPNFSASYRTRDDFGIVVFKQTRSGIAVKLENSSLNGSGGIDRATIYVTLDELNKLRGMILEAKQRLDEMK